MTGDGRQASQVDLECRKVSKTSGIQHQQQLPAPSIRIEVVVVSQLNNGERPAVSGPRCYRDLGT